MKRAEANSHAGGRKMKKAAHACTRARSAQPGSGEGLWTQLECKSVIQFVIVIITRSSGGGGGGGGGGGAERRGQRQGVGGAHQARTTTSAAGAHVSAGARPDPRASGTTARRDRADTTAPCRGRRTRCDRDLASWRRRSCASGRWPGGAGADRTDGRDCRAHMRLRRGCSNVMRMGVALRKSCG